jgi:uncharacterized protein
MDLNTPGMNSSDASVPGTQASSPRPVASAERIQTIDTIRGVALLGILMMNMPGFGINWTVFPAILNGSHNTADYKTLAVIEIFFSGTMRGLFSMLFGAGMILFTMNKKETPGGVTVAEYYYRRLLWLVFFGLINAYVLLWPGDILYFYGLCGMLLYPFRKTSPKWLLTIGLFCMLIGALKTVWWYNELSEKRRAYVEAIAAEKANKKLTDKQQEAKTAWLEVEKNQKPDTAQAKKDIEKMRSGYATIFTFFIPQNAGGETWGMYHGCWDMLCMMFIGMALFRWGFFSNKISISAHTMGLLIGYGIGIPVGLVFFDKGLQGWVTNFSAYIDAYRVPHWVLGDIRRLFLCIGHASLIMLIFRSRIVPWLMKGLANVGQMAFTNYLVQSIICTLIFYGYGLCLYNRLQFHQLYYVVAGIWIFQLIFSAIWLRYYRFGPFEWLWRSLTYWRKQPMKISDNTKKND